MKPVEEELREAIVALGGGDRSSEIVIARHGWGENCRRTLEDVGTQFGLTRERVRQICARAESRAHARRCRAMPRLDEAIEIMKKSVPCTFADMRRRLLEAGISEGRIDGEGLVHAAEFFGRNPGVKSVRIGAGGIIVGGDVDWRVGRARKVARKLVGSKGVTTAGEVAAVLYGRVSEEEQERYEEVVRVELDADPNVVWLDQKKGWLWMQGLPDRRNRLLNNIRKVLSVCGRIGASELRKAVRRDWRMGRYAPPSAVLLALADVAPGLMRVGSEILPVGSCKREDFLSRTELVVVEALLKNDGVMRYEELEQMAAKSSVGIASFRTRMSQSPVVRKYAPRVYGLYGVFVSATKVDELAGPWERKKVVQDCGWTDDGRVWVAYRMSNSTIKAAVVSVPASLRGFIEGDYHLMDGSGEERGTLVVRDYVAWGLRWLLRVSGAEPGDSLILLFDLGERKCSCYVGDEFTLEDLLEAEVSTFSAK